MAEILNYQLESTSEELLSPVYDLQIQTPEVNTLAKTNLNCMTPK
jgi:hypothetical protein